MSLKTISMIKKWFKFCLFIYLFLLFIFGGVGGWGWLIRKTPDEWVAI
jgi:hypothetical protein